MPELSPLEAIQKVLQDSPPRKFPESIEVAINLKELDLALPKNRVDEEVALPQGRGKPVKVGIFATNEMAAKVRGTVDLVVVPDTLDENFGNKRQSRKRVNAIDFFLAEAPLMTTIGKRLGTVMGPRGKVPRPIPSGSDPAPIVQALRRSVRVRNRGKRTFHAPVGTRDMKPEQLAANLQAVLDRVTGKLERGRNNIESVYVKTTQGPSVRLW
jgi:large subunit ribosomal protein L1